MDNELLARLLNSCNRLVIPGFGAFLRKESTGGSTIVFSPFLKKDDGDLVRLLIQEYGVSNFQAEAMISEWVSHIKTVLAGNRKYHIEGVGILIADSNGALTMIAEPTKQNNEPQPNTKTEQPTTTNVQIPSSSMGQTQINTPQQPVTEDITPKNPIINNPVSPQISNINPQPVSQPIAQPVSQPIAQPISQPVAQPVRPAIPTLNSALRPSVPSPATAPIPPKPIPRPSAIQPPSSNWQRPATPPSPVQPISAQQSTPQTGVNTAPQPVRAPQMTGPNGVHRPVKPDMQGGPKPLNRNQPQRTQKPRPKQKKQVEVLLVIAIIAALLITALIIYGLLSASPTNQYYDV